jgi:antitoxin MazE
MTEMVTKAAKWGHSLAMRIPKIITNKCGITENTMVDISTKGNKIIITPLKDTEYCLEELLMAVTKENMHSEVDFGDPVGKEIL